MIHTFEYYTPDCTIGIAPQVRVMIQKHLDAQYGSVPCNRELFRQISLVDVNTCEQLGGLAQETEKNPALGDINNIVCLRAAKDILEEFSKESGTSIPLLNEILKTRKQHWICFISRKNYLTELLPICLPVRRLSGRGRCDRRGTALY